MHGNYLKYPHIQSNLYNMDIIGTAINCPVRRGVLISEVLYVHMSMQGMANGKSGVLFKEVAAFRRCSVQWSLIIMKPGDIPHYVRNSL